MLLKVVQQKACLSGGGRGIGQFLGSMRAIRFP
jgi:hypothetical protein